MVPSYTTLETATRARIEDRAHEAEQYRLARLARQSSATEGGNPHAQIDLFGWLRQLATRIADAGA
ncbi:MAG TPA: hypothetical protein VGJ87_01115 [Roseiflexaceae bacterium]